MNKKTFFSISFFVVILFLVFVGVGFSTRVADAQSAPSTRVFGWAWAGTSEGPDMGAGWIKFSNCDDDDANGVPDPGSCEGPDFGVNITQSNNVGNLSGHAWSNNIGWISFDRADSFTNMPTSSKNPPCDDPGNGSGAMANINLSNAANRGRINGWAKAISAVETDGWDGWIHLSDNNAPTLNPSSRCYSAVSRHPSGPSYINGNGGITYNPLNASIVGNAWGGPVIGWLKFINVTFGSPSTLVFDYSLSNNGPINIARGGPSGIGRVTRTLVSGVSVPVSLSIISALPTGVTAVVSPTNNPCSPTCVSDITFTATANASVGSYTVRASGAPGGGNPVQPRTTDIVLNVTSGGGPTGNPEVSCTVGTSGPYYVNNEVEWRVAVTEGQSPYTVDWEFLSINPPADPTTAQTSGVGPNFTYKKSYEKIGTKAVRIVVTDALNETGECETEPINVQVKPFIKEK